MEACKITKLNKKNYCLEDLSTLFGPFVKIRYINIILSLIRKKPLKSVKNP